MGRAGEKAAARKAEVAAQAEADHKRQPICGAKKRDGSPCLVQAGRGTDHLGTGRCRRHEGKPGLMATTSALVEGRPTTPSQAIQGVLNVMCGQLVYINSKIAELDEDELWQGEERERLNKWIRWRERTIDRAAKVAAAATAMGLAERQGALVEAQTEYVSNLLENVIGDLRLTEAQRKRVGPAIRRHMADVDVGARELAA